MKKLKFSINKKICKLCEGSGKIISYDISGHAPYDVELICNKCKGTGYEDNKVKTYANETRWQNALKLASDKVLKTVYFPKPKNNKKEED